MTETHKESEHKPKVLILGESRVGKSSLRNYILGRPIKAGQYSEKSVSDIIHAKMSDGTIIEIHDIQDITKLKDEEELQKQYLSNFHGLLLMFAINDKSSFEAIPELLTMVIEQNKRKLIPFAIVGNKNDLRVKGEEFITYKESAEYTKKISEWAKIEVPYFDISLKFDKGVQPVKDYITKREIIPLKT